MRTAVGSGKPACINVLLDKEGMTKTSTPYIVQGGIIMQMGEGKTAVSAFITNEVVMRSNIPHNTH
ncbi:MAG: hypothetical protein GY775_14725 [Candidatus Scalindua sp.]|nr:hypothetical protein [Candidatus Scalindua sp.]